VVLMDEIVFVLSDNNLREGGRPRNPLETYLNVNHERAAFLGEDVFVCRTDDGEEFEARISGDHFKNFRSRPVIAIGNWLKLRCRALPGDEVRARWLSEGVLGLQYVRKYALPEKDEGSVQARRLERETEEGVCAGLRAAGVEAQRQVRVASGVIDILAPGAIYEVKTFLTRDSLFHGVGQLFVYRTEVEDGAARRLVLVGRETHETAGLIPVLAKLGVEVEPWSR
jgi:hypothetical protein